jgi:hypothetical protein
MISYKLVSLLVIVILFSLIYKLNSNTRKESFNNNNNNSECRDVNEDYCSAFNNSSPECTPGSNTDVSSDCRRTCGLCDIESSTVRPNNYVSPLNVLEENNQNSNVSNNMLNNNQTNRYSNGVTPSDVNIINNNMPNNTTLSNSLQTNSQILSENSSENSSETVNSEGNDMLNNLDVYSEQPVTQSIPTPSNSVNRYNSYISQESETVNEEIDKVNEVTYKFNVDDSLVNDFKSSNIKKQFSEKFNVPIELIESVTIIKGSVIVNIKFKTPVLVDVFDDFSVNINGVSYKGSANFDENSGEIKPYEQGYSGVNNINNQQMNTNNTINNLLNMAQNSNMNDIQNYLNNFSLSDLFYILKQLLSLNINQNGISDLIEVINGMISSKNNNSVNNLDNNLNNLNNNSVINHSPNTSSGKQYSNGQITQKDIKGVGNVFAPRIIISDDQNNI